MIHPMIGPVAPFKVGDIVRVERKWVPTGSTWRTTHQMPSDYTARVSGIPPTFGLDAHGRPGWAFTYAPCDRPDSVQCGHGFTFAPITPGRYGVQRVTVIGFEKTTPPPRMPNLYHNPGYDLMM